MQTDPVRRYIVAALLVLGCNATSVSPTPVSNISPAARRATCEQHLAALRIGRPDALAADDPLRYEHYSRVFVDRAARKSARTRSCCEEVAARDVAQEIGCCSVSETASQHPTCVKDSLPPATDFAQATPDLKFAFAVAAFADVMRGNSTWSLDDIRAIADANAMNNDRRELVSLIDAAMKLRSKTASLAQ